ncbi:hypothetical protein ACFXDF_39275 [Streptomyces sp. NPDC059426]
MTAYETPVSDRLWHLTATGSTPSPCAPDPAGPFPRRRRLGHAHQ